MDESLRDSRASNAARTPTLPCALLLICLVGGLFSSSCARTVQAPMRLYNLQTAEVINGSFEFSGRTRGRMAFTSPNGEAFQGEYVTVPSGDVTWGAIFATVWSPSMPTTVTGSGYSVNHPRQYRGSAVMTSDRGTVIECEYLTNTSRYNPQGYGACRDNRGNTYKLMF